MRAMTPTTLWRVLSVGLVLVAANPPADAGGHHPPPGDGGGLDACSAPHDMNAARARARRLVRQIRADLAAVEDQIRAAPFIAAVEAGTASVELVAAVVAEEYSIVRSDINSFTQMKTRFDPAPPHGSHFFGDLADGEALALPLVLDFGATVGLDEQDLADYEPRARSQTYPSRVSWIASSADRASGAASFLVNFGVFGENMARIRDALIAVYGFKPVPGFEDDAIEVIAAGLIEGACPRDVRRSARLLQAYELDFWLAASDPPGSPLPVER